MAMVLDLFVQTTLGKLAVISEQEACKVLGVKEEIKKLRRRMMRISSFLEDAERKRHTDKAINTWVKELKDIMYDAEDVIEFCMFQGGKLLELQHPSSSTISFPLSLLSSCFSCVKYRHEIANRIQELNNRLKEIADDNQVMPRLVESSNHGSQGLVVSSQATSPIQVDSDIVGTQIEDAANYIIKWILEDDQKQCQVYGVVGMGGIGKTTLARKIFNDKKIIDSFPTQIWLYVSKNYSETKLFKELIRKMGGNDDGAESIAELGEKFVSTFRSNNRKILLVLDDVWSADVWNNLLRTPIVSSGVIGKILITSRDVKVGKAIGASNDHIHHVEKIDEAGGWELLRKIVFRDGDESMLPVLKEVGISIVARCDGLPLAIKVMAGILFCKKRNRREWVKVLESDLWQMNQIDDEIPRALYLSYEDLPSKLKPCFLSCALIMGKIHPQKLVRLWMAEGFIVEQQNMLMEELGEDYYNELVSRNLLQSNPNGANIFPFVMHDLLRALATNLMEEGIVLGEDETLNINNPLTKIRWLTMSNKGDTLTLHSAIIEQNCLRVLQVHSSPETKTIEDDTLKVLRCLRVLDLSDISIGSIPNSIGELLYLRYLCLNRTNICELPESIGDLINLQALHIMHCRSLYRLPNSITGLCNLRGLGLNETPLTHVPKGIGKLMNINYLEGFVVGCDDSASSDGCDLEELQSLSNMRTLRIDRLERASAKGGAMIFATQRFLRILVICWSEQSPRDNSNGAPSASDEEQVIERAESVCSQLSPPSSLEQLYVTNYPGGRLPGWIMSTSLGASFPHLTHLGLNCIPLCTVLPPLGQLPQLKFLSIKRALRIKKIGSEFLGGHGFSRFPAFPKLFLLKFLDMPNWEEWELCTEREEEKVGDERSHLKLFPNLTECYLKGCSGLIALPEVFHHATNLKELSVQGCRRLEIISDLPALKHLSIKNCSSLEHVENVGMLQSLHVRCSPTNKFLPKWLLKLLTRDNHQSLHSVMDFQMICSLPLLKSCLKGKPNWYIIQQIPRVYIKTIDNKHWMRHIKDPPYYDTTIKADSECTIN